MSQNTILERLQKMAQRLGLNSNQIMLMYAANNGWTNLEMTVAGVNILHKIAGDHKISLYDEDPFIVQLIAKGIILPEEALIFGWKAKTDADSRTDRPSGDDEPSRTAEVSEKPQGDQPASDPNPTANGGCI